MIKLKGPVEGSDSPDGKLDFSPQTDIRNCGVDLVSQVIQYFRGGFNEEGNPLPWAAELLTENSLTPHELADACLGLSMGLHETLNNPDTNLSAELTKSGFHGLPRRAQEIVLAQAGRQLMGMVVYCSRDSAIIGQVPHYQVALEKLLKEGNKIATVIAQARP